MITASNLSFQFGKKIIVNNASFLIESSERAAIVGANGSGKSTLLKIICGDMQADAGEISVSKNSTIGYLPQEAVLNSSDTLYDELNMPFLNISSYQEELNKIEHALSEIDHSSDEWKRLSNRWDFLNHELIRLDAYNIDSKIKKVASGLGFSLEDLNRKCPEFSGGWQMRILLAKILLQNPDILLLDEPTNHLDLETMIWLEEWIAASDCDLIMVSHERAFIDKLVNKIIEIDRGNLTVYRGNYTHYLEERKERREHHRRAYENQQLEINQIKRFIDKFRANASRAAQVQSRIKQLEKIDLIPPPSSEEDSIHFKFPEPLRSNKEVVILKNITKKYGNLTVLKNIDYTIYRGDRIALLGVNGAGKSTLIKMIAGADEPTEGQRIAGSQVIMEYFSQYQYDSLNPSNDVYGELGSVAPPEFTSELRNLLGAFLFCGDDVFKKVSVLSGGEKTRLKLAKMLYSRANLLLLDEPTNHLDIASRRTLETSLEQYSGTIVFVSHDRYFIDKIANKILEVADGQIKLYVGNYSDYLRTKKYEEAQQQKKLSDENLNIEDDFIDNNDKSAPDNINQNQLFQKKSKEQKRLEAEQRQKISAKRKIIEKNIKDSEIEIEKSENRLKEIENLLGSTKIYTKQNEIQGIIVEKRELEEKLPALLEKWEKDQVKLQELLDSIQNL